VANGHQKEGKKLASSIKPAKLHQPPVLFGSPVSLNPGFAVAFGWIYIYVLGEGEDFMSLFLKFVFL
jgi:hypothetical protein